MQQQQNVNDLNARSPLSLLGVELSLRRSALLKETAAAEEAAEKKRRRSAGKEESELRKQKIFSICARAIQVTVWAKHKTKANVNQGKFAMQTIT